MVPGDRELRERTACGAHGSLAADQTALPRCAGAAFDGPSRLLAELDDVNQPTHMGPFRARRGAPTLPRSPPRRLLARGCKLRNELRGVNGADPACEVVTGEGRESNHGVHDALPGASRPGTT